MNKFSQRQGAVNGVYRVESRMGAMIAMRCSICGRTWLRSKNWWIRVDMNACHCAEFTSISVTGLSAATKLGTTRTYIRRQVERRMHALGLDGGAEKYVDPDAILRHVGPKPDPTDLRKPKLYIQDGLPPSPENFYWKWELFPSIVGEVLAKSRGIKNRRWLSERLSGMTDDQIRDAVRDGLPRVQSMSRYPYEDYIGRSFGSLEVMMVSMRETSGTTRYMFTCKCRRCGRLCTRRAWDFIRKKIQSCTHCGCQRHAGRAKNSAAIGKNQWSRRTWQSVENPGLPTRMIMLNYMSEFTLFRGTQEYIEALADMELDKNKTPTERNAGVPEGAFTKHIGTHIT